MGLPSGALSQTIQNVQATSSGFIKLKISSFIEAHRNRELDRLSATFAIGKWRLVGWLIENSERA